jgi:hypothetical protein
VEDVQVIHIQVRLQPFERTLLQLTLDYFLDAKQHPPSEASPEASDRISDIDADAAGAVLFFHWSWADNVLRQVLTELDPDWVNEAHLGEFASAIEVFRKQLRTRVRGRNDLYDRQYYRAEQLLLDNPHLRERGGVEVDNVTVVPHPEDASLWRMMGANVLKNVDRMETWPGVRKETSNLLRLYRCGSSSEQPFLPAVRSHVAKMFEETPDFPPANLFAGMGDDTEETASAESEDDRGGIESLSGDIDSVPLTESYRERIRDWAEITAGNIIVAEDLWDVWSWCRMVLVSVQNRQHARDVGKLLTSEAFARYWRVENDIAPGARTIVSAQPYSEFLSQRLVSFYL